METKALGQAMEMAELLRATRSSPSSPTLEFEIDGFTASYTYQCLKGRDGSHFTTAWSVVTIPLRRYPLVAQRSIRSFLGWHHRGHAKWGRRRVMEGAPYALAERVVD
ncbi:MAG TPA: hypothetical protein VGC41_19845, partial [Kofleriaceae bacterium]